MVEEMNNNDERDYEEEEANRRLMEEGDDEGVPEPWAETFARKLDDGTAYTGGFTQEEVEGRVVATAKVEEPKHHWYITFGYDHRDPVTNVHLQHRYCIVEDTYLGARDQIMARFSTGWAAIYPCADDLPREERVVDGRTLPEHKWRGAGVQRHGLTYFDHRMEESTIADQIEHSREKDGYYDPEED